MRLWRWDGVGAAVRTLVILLLIAAGIALATPQLPSGAESVDEIGLLVSNLKGGRMTVDFPSFGLGVAAGTIGLWLGGVRWRLLPYILAGVLRSWRRNVVLASMAVTCIGVLLFY